MVCVGLASTRLQPTHVIILTKQGIFLTLCWPEINNLVGSLGYKLVNTYEIYQYKNELKIFEKFIQILFHFKIKHSNKDFNSSWNSYCNEVNVTMKFENFLKLHKIDMSVNNSKAKYFKSFLVSFLGKFSQVNSRTKNFYVRSNSALSNLFHSEDIYDFFIYDRTCHVIVKNKKPDRYTNRKSNSIIYSYVCGLARIFILMLE